MHLLLKLVTICGCILFISAAPASKNKQKSRQTSADDDILGLNRYNLPDFSSDSSNVDIEKTIGQVEQILKLNPQLPHLSRNEILFLLKNITTQDKIEAENDAETIVGSNAANKNKAKTQNGQTTMIVLPYKAEDTSNGDVTELFTKAPLVTYVPPNNDNNKPVYKNHKYSQQKSKPSNKNNGSKNSPNEFWNNQAKKVKDDLEKQNEPKKISLDIPFKKMPDVEIPVDFSKNNEVLNEYDVVDLKPLNKLLGENKFESVGAFKPLALYDFKSLPEPVTNFELVLPKGGNVESLVAHPTSSYLDNDYKSGNTYVPAVETNYGASGYIAPKMETSAYSSFKPLPIKDTKNGNEEDLDEILKKYGLTDSVLNTYLPSTSNETSSSQQEVFSNSDLVEDDMFPASMTSLLTDMGLTKKKGRKMNEEDIEDSYSYDAPPKVDTKYGIDPMNDDEMNGVYESLNMIKREMDDDVTQAEVKEVKNDKQVAAKLDDVKETTTESKDEASDRDNSDDDSKETNDAKDNGPSIEALEDSFGASPADDDPSEAVLPPPRRNGFYYMVDWNSFLEVGEEGKRRVNIRFEPKLGDPYMFIFGNKNNNK